MLLEKFVEEHGVDGFVADAVNAMIAVAHNQFGIHLIHFLGDETKLRCAVRVQLRFVAEGYRSERKQYVAGFFHVLYVLFEASRGGTGAELAERVDEDRGPAAAGRTENTSDE